MKRKLWEGEVCCLIKLKQISLILSWYSYQYHHPKTIYTDCIYRKIYKKSKGKPSELDLPLLKNDITNNLETQKPVIYSRYLQVLS